MVDNLDLSPELVSTIRVLDALVDGPLQPEIEDAVTAARAMLAATDEPFGWHFLDLGSVDIPEGIRSGAVFVLPRGSTPPGHRHPNSIQHMRVLAGEAVVTLQRAEEHPDDPARYRVGQRRPWLVIPQDVMHQLEVSQEGDLVVLSFHTVSEAELLEVGSEGQRTYSSPDDPA